MNRSQAFLTGATRYDADKPCRFGHFPTQRYVSSGACVTCMGKRYKRMQHPLANVVYVPAELQSTFDAFVKAMGLKTEARPGSLPHVEPLIYSGDSPGTAASIEALKAASFEAVASPEMAVYDQRRAELMVTRDGKMPPVGRELYDALTHEREARDRMLERVAVKHGVTIEELLHTIV